jgi:uncharacterized membrane protein YgdD (TMEM256/DUF423 family)
MHKRFLLIAAAFGALAVILGAFGAHGLKQIVPAETVAAFQTGVQYQMYHAIALLAVAILYERYASKMIEWTGYCFILGTVLFSGSLYLLSLLKATGTVGLTGVGIITPFGGLFFIAGWLLMFAGILKRK